jgi:hypothetical protein
MAIEDNSDPCTHSFVSHGHRIYHTHGYLSCSPSYVPSCNMLPVGFQSAGRTRRPNHGAAAATEPVGMCSSSGTGAGSLDHHGAIFRCNGDSTLTPYVSHAPYTSITPFISLRPIVRYRSGPGPASDWRSMIAWPAWVHSQNRGGRPSCGRMAQPGLNGTLQWQAKEQGRMPGACAADAGRLRQHA